MTNGSVSSPVKLSQLAHCYTIHYSTSASIIHRFVQVTFTYYITSLLIVGYIVGFQILYKQAYLEKAQVQGTLEMKDKGTALLQPEGSSTASIFDEVTRFPCCAVGDPHIPCCAVAE